MPSSRPASSRGRNPPDLAAAFDSPKLKANRHLILDSSAASSATSVSNSRASEAAISTHNHSNGLLNTLHHFLPRHAQFNVCVQIHQIDNIPLTQGEFAVRWRVKNAVNNARRKTGASSTHSLLGLVGSKGKKQKSADTDSIDQFNSRVADHLERHGPIIPSVVVVTDSDSPSHRPTPLPSSDYATSSSSIHSSLSSSVAVPFSCSSVSPPEPLCNHDQIPTPPKGMTPFLPLKDHSVVWSQGLHTTVKMSISRPKSSSTANTTFPTDENGLLLPSPMKLVIVQRVIPGDPGAPRNPRLGAVYLDLAEYAGVEGETTRKYLLRESKINATLKLTISITHVGGETHFTAPPLPKGEILNGICGILERDVYKTRPKALDLYGPYYNYSQHQRELADGLRPNNSNPVSRAPSHALSDTSDEEDGHNDSRQFFASHEDLQRTIHRQPRPKSKSHMRSTSLDDTPIRPPPQRTHTDPAKLFLPSQSRVARSSPLSPIAASPLSTQSRISPLSSAAIPFDVSHLPFAYGPKTTETLIEAIFNPVPVAEKPGMIGNRTKIGKVPVQDNPFVYFISKEDQQEDVTMTIGRGFTRQTSPSEGPGTTFLRPKSSDGRISSSTASNEMGDASSVYSTTSGPSSSAASFVTLGSTASKSSSSKGKSSSSGGSNHDEHNQSEAHIHFGKGWLRKHHKETRILAQSNPHEGTRPDLYGRVDSVVGIVL